MQTSRFGKKNLERKSTILYLGAPSSADKISGTTPAHQRLMCRIAHRRRVVFAMPLHGQIVSRPCWGHTDVLAENAFVNSRGRNLSDAKGPGTEADAHESRVIMTRSCPVRRRSIETCMGEVCFERFEYLDGFMGPLRGTTLCVSVLCW